MKKPVCAVVGVGPGIGAALARRFHRAGHRVALLSRSTGCTQKLAEELGDEAFAVACDVSEETDIKRAFAEVRSHFGAISTLLYNAGSGVWGDVLTISPGDFERSWRVNTMGAFLTTREVLPAMIEAGAGNIVYTGATASLRGKPFTTAFAPAKAAQRSLAQAVARYAWPKGVHVALFIVDGMVAIEGKNTPGEADDPNSMLNPDDIAASVQQLTEQNRSAWTLELDLRPYVEQW